MNELSRLSGTIVMRTNQCRGNISLIEPTPKLDEDFCSMATEFLAEGDDRYSQAMADGTKFVEWCASSWTRPS